MEVLGGMALCEPRTWKGTTSRNNLPHSSTGRKSILANPHILTPALTITAYSTEHEGNGAHGNGGVRGYGGNI